MGGLHGILVPVITPFGKDDELDLLALRSQLDATIAAGVHGVIPAGSTGEAMSLSATEYRTVVETTIEHVDGRVPVIAGCSANATRQVIANCDMATNAGADAIMLVHPFYSLPDQEELFRHYSSVSAAVQLPVIIYNNPFSTGVDALPELFGRLAGLPHLEYVKESSGDCTRIPQILTNTAGRMTVFCGTDNQALEQLASGASGWVAGCANAIPDQCVELYSLIVEKGDLRQAQALYQKMLPYVTIAEGTGKFVQVNKAAVELLGRSAGRPRQPLEPIDDQIRAQVSNALAIATSASVPELASV